MDRPAREQVDEAISRARAVGKVDNDWLVVDVDVLQREVRALRVVADDLSGALEVLSDSEADNDKLRAAIARVEALCGMNHKDRLIRVEDIRNALRG